MTTTDTLNADGAVNLAASGGTLTTVEGTLLVAEQADFTSNLDANAGLDVTGLLQADDNVLLGVDNTDDVTLNASILDQDDLSGNALTFEGATPDDILTEFVITDPLLSTKTITFPDATGTVALTGATLSNDIALTTDGAGQVVNALEGQPFNVQSAAINLGDGTGDQVILVKDTGIKCNIAGHRSGCYSNRWHILHQFW